MSKFKKTDVFRALREAPHVIRYKRKDNSIKAAVFSLEDDVIDPNYRDDLLAQTRKRSEPGTLRAYSVTDAGYRTINVDGILSIDETTVVYND